MTGDMFELIKSGAGVVAAVAAVVFGISLSLAALLVTRRVWRRLTLLRASLNFIVLQVTVPRDTGSPDDRPEAGKSGPQAIQDQIGVAEVLWSAIGGLRAQRGVLTWLKGRSDHLALELVAEQGLISYYLAVPKQLRSFIEQQVNAHYPHAVLEEVSDYNIFTPRGTCAIAQLKMARSSGFPLKTYKQFEADPLSGILNVLSKIPADEGAAVQLVVRSARRGWRRRGVELASKMQQGKTLAEASRSGWWHGAVSLLGGTLSASKSKSDRDHKPHEPRRLSPLEEEMVKGIEQKAAKAGLDTTLRLVTSGRSRAAAVATRENLSNAFAQYSIYQYGNQLSVSHPRAIDNFLRDFIHRAFNDDDYFVLNTEELASIYHFPLPSTETPNIRWLAARRAAAPVNAPRDGLVLGTNNYRGVATTVKIKQDDRRRHVYVIGKSGTGKSVLLQNMAVQDIREGRGVCVVDPHGDLVEAILGQVPPERAQDVIIFDPGDVERPLGLNMLEYGDESQKDFTVQEMIAIFYKLFPPEMIGPMFEHNMRNVMLTLMADQDTPGTIADIPRMFTDPAFQKYKVGKVTDPVVRAFWEKEMAKTTDFHKSEMLGYLISKVGRFVENEMMRNIIGQPESGFDVRDVMDNGKILLVNLAKGKTGEVNSQLLGLIIVSKLQMAALARADTAEANRRDFYLYIDEFQNFITDSIATILSEARKYRLNLTIAHQYLGQLSQGNDTKIKDAVLGTTGTMISFKVGAEDAEVLSKEFAPVFTAYDLINVEQYNAYVKLLIDNAPTRPFNMRTLPPGPASAELAAGLKQRSRQQYGRDRKSIEAEILERSRLGEPSTQPPAQAEATR